jgi:hypothetical protein
MTTDAELEAHFEGRVAELQDEFGVDYAEAVRLFTVELLTESEAKWGKQFVLDMIEHELAKLKSRRKPH